MLIFTQPKGHTKGQKHFFVKICFKSGDRKISGGFLTTSPSSYRNVTNLNSLDRTHSYQIKSSSPFQTFGAYNWSQGHNDPVQMIFKASLWFMVVTRFDLDRPPFIFFIFPPSHLLPQADTLLFQNALPLYSKM